MSITRESELMGMKKVSDVVAYALRDEKLCKTRNINQTT